PSGLQRLDDVAPARAVSPRAVDEHDARRCFGFSHTRFASLYEGVIIWPFIGPPRDWAAFGPESCSSDSGLRRSSDAPKNWQPPPAQWHHRRPTPLVS